MSRRTAVAAACLPGGLLVLAALAGWGPGVRDAPTYFAPLRARTAEVLVGRHSPWWDGDIGCGEPYFANPQTALLYPPAWAALVLAPEAAVGAEAGLHLAILGAGCALLSLALGCRSGWALAAAWAVALAGPTIDAAGVLNNLETLAWLPWLWWAAASGRLRWIPIFVACAWLAAEPQLAVLGVAIACTLAPRRSTLAAALLGFGVVAVQAVPFTAWVLGGDRGPGLLAEVRGALGVGQLLSFLVPGVAGGGVGADAFIVHPTLPLWVAVLGLLAVWRCHGPARRLAVWAWFLLAAAVVAGLPGGDRFWAAVTAGLVRYPARLLLVTAAALPVAAAAAASTLMPIGRRAVGAAAAAIALGLIASGGAAAVTGQAIALAVSLGGPWAAVGGVVGSALLAPLHVAALEIHRVGPVAVPCLDAQRSVGRIYSLEPSREQLSWLAAAPRRRAAALGYGYTALLDGRRTARSFAPLMSRAAARHLAEADTGPQGRWWLDSLAAERLVGQRRIPGFELVCEADDVVVMGNPQAWPEVSVVRALPEPGEVPVAGGEVSVLVRGAAAAAWTVSVGPEGGVLQRLTTPDPGWRWRVDGVSERPLRGSGIIHGVALTPGTHRVEVRYLPPGLALGAAISVLALLLVGVAWRRW